MSLFFKGLAKSEELVDRIILGSGSSSGIFRRFLPTAKSEFLCLFCGRQLMASFERLSEKEGKKVVKLTLYIDQNRFHVKINNNMTRKISQKEIGY